MYSAGAVVRAVRSVVPSPASHHRPDIGSAEAQAVSACLADITSYRPVENLEAVLAKACGTRHAVATSSGSAALEIALKLVGVEPGDVVLVPSMAFAAVAAAVVHLGAEPIFLDALFQDFGLNPYKLAKFLEREAIFAHPVTYKGRRLSAIVAVHVLGHPCSMVRLKEIAGRWHLPIVEDAAEALGSVIGDRPCGSWGTVGVLSFNYNKIVTGGGGGAVLTNNEGAARLATRLATTARVDHPWLVEHDSVGWNYRMPTVCAALACAQMMRLPLFLRSKRALAAAYAKALETVPGVSFHAQPEGTSSNYWLCTLLVDPRWTGGRDEVLAALHEHGLRARAAFTPLNLLPPYMGYRDDNSEVAKDIHRRAVCLPSGPALGERLQGRPP